MLPHRSSSRLLQPVALRQAGFESTVAVVESRVSHLLKWSFWWGRRAEAAFSVAKLLLLLAPALRETPGSAGIHKRRIPLTKNSWDERSQRQKNRRERILYPSALLGLARALPSAAVVKMDVLQVSVPRL